MIPAYQFIQILIALIRAMDSLVDGAVKAAPKEKHEEIRVIVAEARVARTREERVDASKKLREHFKRRSS